MNNLPTLDSDSSQRVFWADASRAAAAVLGVLVHTFDPLFKADQRSNISWWTVSFVVSMGHACVPIYLMLSGSFLLPKAESTANFYRKRLKRLLIPLAAWSVIYSFWDRRSISFFFHGSNVWQLISIPLQRPEHYHLWFMYVMIGLYIIMPFVGKIVLNSSGKELFVFLSLWLVVSSVLPILSEYGWLRTGTGLEMMTGFTGYLVVGYAIGRLKLSKKMGLALAAVFLINVSVTAFGTYYLSNRDNALNETFLLPLQPNVILMSISLFALIKFFIGSRPPNRLLSFTVTRLRKTSYGIYLLHPLILESLYSGTYGIDLHHLTIEPMLVRPVVALVVLFSSYIFVVLLQKTPVVQKIVP